MLSSPCSGAWGKPQMLQPSKAGTSSLHLASASCMVQTKPRAGCLCPSSRSQPHCSPQQGSKHTFTPQAVLQDTLCALSRLQGGRVLLQACPGGRTAAVCRNCLALLPLLPATCAPPPGSPHLQALEPLPEHEEGEAGARVMSLKAGLPHQLDW